MLNLDGTLLLIIISLVCKSDIKEVHYNFSNLFTNVRGQKNSSEVYKCRNSIPNINHFILNDIYHQHPVRGNKCLKGRATIGHPFAHQLHIVISFYNSHRFVILIQIIYKGTLPVSIRTKPGVMKTRHIACPTGFGAYSSTFISRDGKMCRHHGGKLFPILTALLINTFWHRNLHSNDMLRHCVKMIKSYGMLFVLIAQKDAWNIRNIDEKYSIPFYQSKYYSSLWI